MKGQSQMRNNGRRKEKRKMWYVILVVLLIISGLALTGILIDGPGRREIAGLSFPPINFKKLHDGTYIGEYKGTKSHIRDAQVKVSIDGGEISDIEILKGAVDKEGKPVVVRGGKSIVDLFDNVVKSESLQVDVISGATLTSKTHLKALENALEQAEEK